MIAKVVGLDRSVISRNVQNTKISDMHNLLSQGHDMDYIGWKVTRRIECPLSSERLSGNQVQKMQDKRILWKTLLFLRAYNINPAFQRTVKNITIEKNQSIKCLVLGRLRHIPVNSQPGQKSFHLGFAHVLGIFLS
jgi:hypothetical protein